MSQANQTINTEQAMRYARQIMLPGIDIEGQERLLNSNVLVFGLGGLGCAAAQYLVGAGIGKLTLVDDDQVETSNLHRQVLHGEADIGLTKVESAKASLKVLNSKCELTTIAQRLEDNALDEVVSQHDLVLDCTDNLQSRNTINLACVAQKKPLVVGSALRFEGQVSSFSMDELSPCYACLSSTFTEPNLSCAEAGILPPIAGIVGNIQALEAIKIRLGIGKNLVSSLLLIDGLSMEFRQFTITKQTKCPACS